MKVRKKPIVLEAYRWWTNGDHPEDQSGQEAIDLITGIPYIRLEGKVVRYFRHPKHPGEETHSLECRYYWKEHGWIDTLEGGHIVCPGDWVITGVRGEHYPIKHNIFLETYEEVNDDD